MLSPNVIDICDDLAQAYSTIKQVDAFSYASMNTTIGKLVPDPSWIGPIRKELTLLSDAGAQWQQQKSVIWTPLLSYFTTYATLFSGVADAVPTLGNNTAAWLELLKNLSSSLATGAQAAQSAQGQFVLQINNLNNVEQVFSQSVNTAWAALAKEEQEMMALAEQITALQDRVNSLEDSISSAEISSDKSYIQSTVTISYTLLSTAGVEIPYLSIAGLVFTVGKLAFDLIVTDKELDETINQIVELRVEASEEAQAAAMTKAIIQLIDNFDKSLLAVERKLPDLAAMWTTEKGKVDAAIAALNAGVSPDQLFDIQSMPSASATWNRLADFVKQLLQTSQQGKPVTIITSKTTPISSDQKSA